MFPRLPPATPVFKPLMEAAGIEPAQDSPGAEFFWRLAGVIEGEGCFSIRPNGNRKSYTCNFQMGLRDDDRPFLEMLRDGCGGIGNIYTITPSRNVKHPRNTKPQAHWHVLSRGDCFELARILDEHPLQSKKARDYALWRRALTAWAAGDAATMAAARDELVRVRAYQPAAVEIQEPAAQLEIAGVAR